MEKTLKEYCDEMDARIYALYKAGMCDFEDQIEWLFYGENLDPDDDPVENVSTWDHFSTWPEDEREEEIKRTVTIFSSICRQYEAVQKGADPALLSVSSTLFGPWTGPWGTYN